MEFFLALFLFAFLSGLSITAYFRNNSKDLREVIREGLYRYAAGTSCTQGPPPSRYQFCRSSHLSARFRHHRRFDCDKGDLRDWKLHLVGVLGVFSPPIYAISAPCRGAGCISHPIYGGCDMNTSKGRNCCDGGRQEGRGGGGSPNQISFARSKAAFLDLFPRAQDSKPRIRKDLKVQ